MILTNWAVRAWLSGDNPGPTILAVKLAKIIPSAEKIKSATPNKFKILLGGIS